MQTITQHIFRHIFLLLCAFSCIQQAAAEPYRDTYTSKDGQFTITIPPLSSVGITREGSSDHANYVTFTSGNGYYWMMDGEYHVDQFQYDYTFDKEAVKQLPVAMRGILLKEKNARLEIQTCEYLRKSPIMYQCVGTAEIQNIPAMYVGTAILNKKHLVNIYALEPLWHGQTFHWARLRQMIHSLKMNLH